VVRFSFDEGAGKIMRGAQLSLAAARALMLRADILHGNDIRGARVLLPYARLSRAPLALTLRDTKPEGECYGASWHRIAQRLDALITLSDDMAERVGDRLPVHKSRRFTINSIVDLDAFRPPDSGRRDSLRARLGIGEEECAIGMIAGIFEKKRQFELIRDVLPKLIDLPVRLHLVGDFDPQTNPYARSCADLVLTHQLQDHVIFHGFRADVADWLAALDIVLVASLREGLARCMIESMACGTPVVSVDVCSAHEMLKRTGAGIVVGRDDWAGLASAVRELSTDLNKRRTMGRAGRKTALAQFSTQRVAQSWHELYANLGGARVE
jgi:glycosyltransferase involved in cell wall biosynthesis